MVQAMLLHSQNAPNTEYVQINGEWAPVQIDGCDTLILLELDEVSFTAPRIFASAEEEAKYRKYKRYAAIVYPYATRAIKIFEETDFVTRHMKKRQRRKHIKRLQKELKEEFEDPLKKLTKTQGYILVEMIEREREESMYELIRGLKNGLSARYWQIMGSFFEYDLKEPYARGQDPILDMILDDLDVSYDLPVSEEEMDTEIK